MKIIFVILFLFSFLNIKVIFIILNYYLLIGVSLNHFNSKYLLKFVKVIQINLNLISFKDFLLIFYQ
jgi:hypothetical protein